MGLPVPEPACQQLPSEEMRMSKNDESEFVFCLRTGPTRVVVIVRREPGTSRMTVIHAQDIKSSFRILISDSVQ